MRSITSTRRPVALAVSAALITLGLLLTTALLAANWAESSIQPTTEERIAAHTAEAERFHYATSLEGQLVRACLDGIGWACRLSVEQVPTNPAELNVWVEPPTTQGIRLVPDHTAPTTGGYQYVANEILESAPLGIVKVYVADRATGELLAESWPSRPLAMLGDDQ